MRRPRTASWAGLLLVLHGLAHTRAGMLAVDAAGGLVPGPHDGLETAWVAAILWATAEAGFVAAGLALLGVSPFASRPRTLIGGAAAASIALFGLFRPEGAVAGVALDLVILALLAAPRIVPASVPAAERPKHRRLGRVAAVLGIVFVAYVAVLAGLRPWHARWGSTREELRAELPGDELAVGPVTYAIQRAVTIEAIADSVWPWLAQMGQGRGGFYSYSGLERLFGLAIHNADRIHPEWQAVAVGDTLFATPRGWLGLDRRLGWRVCRVEPGAALIMEHRREGLVGVGAHAWNLRSQGTGATRFIVRTRGGGDVRSADVILAPLWFLVLEPAHFVMQRRMLLGIKQRAESHSR